ncbi:fimbrial protein [Yersinia aldovae]|uniref:fimbrial protein n=1 Tax=Yersinia aldovae TaxID=29483 RepID=UPI00119F2F74|nr:fimbrial protein [Yersinia aldovae]
MNSKAPTHRNYLLKMGLLVLFLFSIQGRTACLFIGGGDRSTEASWNPGNIDTAGKNVGDLLADSGSRNLSWPVNFTCSATWSRTWQTLIFITPSSLAPPDLNSVMMDTNIPGVGVQVTTLRGDRTTVFPPSPFTNSNLVPNVQYGAAPNGIYVQVKLYKTSDSVGSGALTTGLIYDESIRDTQMGISITRFKLTGGTIINSGCSVATPSVDVNLGMIPKNIFTHIGSTSEAKSFKIDLTNCSINTNVNITFDGVSSGTANILALTPGGATGVGVQLLDNSNNIIPLNAPFFVVNTTEATYSIPLKARYYQTEGAVGTGIANSTANFTMTYN